MGERVWSSFKGVYPGMSEEEKALGKTRWVPANGWTQVLGFVTLKSLRQQIMAKKWKLDKLAIVAHGGRTQGRIELDEELSMKSISKFKTELSNLANFCMNPGGRVIFFACAPASAGLEADRFLCTLSQLMPSCEIVAFSKQLLTGTIGYGGVGDWTGTSAGKMWELGDSARKDVNEYDSIAKWAKNGYIVRPLLGEVKMIQTIAGASHQALNPRKLCGSMNCPGHRAYGDWCKNYTRHPQQYDRIMREAEYIRKNVGGYASVRILSLFGVVNDDGDLVLTGPRNKGLLGYPTDPDRRGGRRKRRPGPQGLQR